MVHVSAKLAVVALAAAPALASIVYDGAEYDARDYESTSELEARKVNLKGLKTLGSFAGKWVNRLGTIATVGSLAGAVAGSGAGQQPQPRSFDDFEDFEARGPTTPKKTSPKPKPKPKANPARVNKPRTPRRKQRNTPSPPGKMNRFRTTAGNAADALSTTNQVLTQGSDVLNTASGIISMVKGTPAPAPVPDVPVARDLDEELEARGKKGKKSKKGGKRSGKKGRKGRGRKNRKGKKVQPPAPQAPVADAPAPDASADPSAAPQEAAPVEGRMVRRRLSARDFLLDEDLEALEAREAYEALYLD